MRTDEYIKFYVIWRCDEDDFLVTLVEGIFTLDDWNRNKHDTKVLCAWAHDQEFPDCPNRVIQGEAYEYITAFTSAAPIEFA